MNWKKLGSAIAAAAVAVPAGILTLAEPAAAAENCWAMPERACVAVQYLTSDVKSIRVNGRCLIGHSGRYPNAVVPLPGTPDVQTYGGTRCEGNTQTRANASWGLPDSEGYRWVWIK